MFILVLMFSKYMPTWADNEQYYPTEHAIYLQGIDAVFNAVFGMLETRPNFVSVMNRL